MIAEVKHSFQRRKFAIDGGILRPLFQTGVDVFLYRAAADFGDSSRTKERFQMEPPSRFCIIQTLAAVDLVIPEKILSEFLHQDPAHGGAHTYP